MGNPAASTSDPALLARLQPFRRRGHGQRALVAFLWSLSIAKGVAAFTLGAYLLGAPLPMPWSMLVGAGIVLLAGLGVMLRQRPSYVQTARTLDLTLHLRDQLTTALEVAESSGQVAARLHHQARDTLQTASPAAAVPWPPLRRAGTALIVTGVVLAAGVLVALQPTRLPRAAHIPQIEAPGRALRPRAAHPPATPPTEATPVQPPTPETAQQSLPGAANTRGDEGTAVARFLGGPMLPSQAPSSGPPSDPASASQRQVGSGKAQADTAGTQSSGQAGQGATGNSARAAASQGQSTSQRSQGRHPGTQAGSGASNPRNNGGSQGTGKNLSRRGSSGAPMATGGGGSPQSSASQSTAQGAAGASHNGAGQSGAQGSGSPGSGRGTGSGAQGAAGVPRANLGSGSSVTLSGSPEQGGQLIMDAGNSGQRIAGAVTTAGDSAGAISSTPSYVAPDSNAVTLEDRAAVRGYFSPPQGNGQ